MMQVRIGLLRLADSAPVVMAARTGIFADLGLEAVLSIEPSWANIADKLAYGLLDAAVMLPPLAIAARLGLRGRKTDLFVPLGLSTGGNTVVLSGQAADAAGDSGDPGETGRLLAAWIAATGVRPRIATVHLFSTHTLLLREWLAQAGLHPERDIEPVVVPPEAVVAALRAGRIDGFCAGAPWGGLAAEEGVGRVLFGTSRLWPGHPEKCLAVAASWAVGQPASMRALLRGLLRAGRLCDDPAASGDVAASLARAFDLPLRATLAALPGGGGAERIGFHAGAAWYAAPAHAAWFAGAMQRWGWIDPTEARMAATGLYRPGWLRPEAEAEGLDWPQGDPEICLFPGQMLVN